VSTRAFQPAPGARSPFLNALLTYTHGDGYDTAVHVGDVLEVSDRGWDAVPVVAMEDGQPVVQVEDADVGFRRVVLDEDEYVHIVDSKVAHDIWEDHQKNGQPDGVAWGDGLVDPALRARLTGLFYALCTDPADYHPGSGTAVRDLVHPSLYPYVHGETVLSPSARVPTPSTGNPSVDRWGRPFEASRYQWLPTDVTVSADGHVHFDSYLNNLDDTLHPGATEPLAELLEVALPLLESVVGYAAAYDPWDHREDDCEADLPEPDMIQPPPEPVAPVSLRGRRLQVIPKLVQYEVDADNTFEGVWHVEGMSHEHIVATALFILDREPHLDGGTLRFKRGYTREEAGQVFWNINQVRPVPVDDMVNEAMVPLGSVDTPQGRLVVFPNSHVHKLTPMRSTTGGRATRRIVVFWLVDPEVRILSTADVPRQQGSMSHERALAHRLSLMEERRTHKQSHNVREISLCEH
jgi:hypothetical protein